MCFRFCFHFFCEKVNFLTAPAWSCCCCGVNLIQVLQFIFDDLQHLLISLERGLKDFYDVELLYPLDLLQRKHKTKNHLYCVADTIKVMFLFYVSSIEDPICLKLVKCFCCYSATTKTSFGFCSCSERHQLKFGGKKNSREMQIAQPPRQLYG